MGKITIKDIARKAGVSPATVSKILTGKYKLEKVKISQKTITRVQDIVKKMNYRPNYGARLLSTGRTYTVGLYSPKPGRSTFFIDHYYVDILNGVGKKAAKYGYDILLINQGAFVEKFNTGRIDALIIIEPKEMNSELQFLIDENKPFVVINNQTGESMNTFSINMDNDEGIRQLVHYFRENNHNNLAFIGELLDEPQSEHKIRLQSFKNYLKQEGMPVRNDLLLLGKATGEVIKREILYYDQQSGYLGMKHLVEKYRGSFTGVFCANDIIALGALDYLYEAGIKVPEELSVIGFDDVDFAGHLMGGLTTISQPLGKMGSEAFSHLMRILDGDKPGEGETILIKPKLISRKTVAAFKNP